MLTIASGHRQAIGRLDGAGNLATLTRHGIELGEEIGMIKIDFKRWVLEVWHKQTWFGYTYVPAMSTLLVSRWHRNNSTIVNFLRAVRRAVALNK